MDELPAPPPRLVRKAAYGRTQLFLPSASTIIREVKCMGGVSRHDAASVYHVLPDAAAGFASACWHCCEEIGAGDAWMPLPRLYDAVEKVYHVYGKTCSPSCAKAYVLEHTTFDRGQHLNVLVKMLREVYGVTGPIAETPPRPALRRFGGAFDPRALKRAECRLVQPPFVSYSMLVEERVGAATELAAEAPVEAVEEAYDLDEPPPPALFDDFLRRQQAPETAQPPVPPPVRSSSAAHATSAPSSSSAMMSRKRPAAQPTAATVGPMSKFVRQR